MAPLLATRYDYMDKAVVTVPYHAQSMRSNVKSNAQYNVQYKPHLRTDDVIYENGLLSYIIEESQVRIELNKLLNGFPDKFLGANIEDIIPEVLEMNNLMETFNPTKRVMKVSEEDECLYTLYVIDSTTLFFNLFFEEGTTIAQINTSINGHFYAFEGTITNVVSSFRKVLK